jgi:hypothetical protein
MVERSPSIVRCVSDESNSTELHTKKKVEIMASHHKGTIGEVSGSMESAEVLVKVFVNAGRKRLNKSSLRLISEPSGSRIFSKGDKVEVVNRQSAYCGFVGSVESVT